MLTKKWMIWLGTMIIALSGCNFRQAMEEENEMLQGKLFLIPHGTVKYNNGITLMFDHYGYFQRVERIADNMVDLYIGKDAYTISLKDSTYTKQAYYEYMTDFVVTTEYYRMVGNYRCSTETIAGMVCDYIEWKTPSCTYEVAGHQRVRLYEKGAENEVIFLLNKRYHNNIAISFNTDTVGDKMFSLKNLRQAYYYGDNQVYE